MDNRTERLVGTPGSSALVAILVLSMYATQARCPNCQSEEAYLRGMTTGAGAGPGWFTFVCDKCRHSWRRDMQPDIAPPEGGSDVTFIPKVDRRKR